MGLGLFGVVINFKARSLGWLEAKLFDQTSVDLFQVFAHVFRQNGIGAGVDIDDKVVGRNRLIAFQYVENFSHIADPNMVRIGFECGVEGVSRHFCVAGSHVKHAQSRLWRR